MCYTGWPRKNAKPTINYFKKTSDKINKLCAILRIKFFFQQDDTKIINFDEGVLILWPFFWCNVIFKTSVSKVTIDMPKIFHCWLPRVKCLLLLWKTNFKAAWIKRSTHYVTLQCYNLGKAVKEIPPYINRDFWYEMLQKNGSRIKTPSSKSLILVSFCRKKNFLRIHALTNWI